MIRPVISFIVGGSRKNTMSSMIETKGTQNVIYEARIAPIDLKSLK